MNTDVYSWRLSHSLKQRLERAALEQDRSLADLLREIAEDWLARTPAEDDPRMEEARRRALGVIGSLTGGDPYRAERASERVRARLAREPGGRAERGKP